MFASLSPRVDSSPPRRSIVEMDVLALYFEGKRDICQTISEKSALIRVPKPTDGLDVDSVKILEQLILAHHMRGGAAILASHDRAFVGGICSHVLVLSKGKVVGEATISWLSAKRTMN